MVREMIVSLVSAVETDGVEALLTPTTGMQKAFGSVRVVGWVGGLAVGSMEWVCDARGTVVVVLDVPRWCAPVGA